MADVATVADPAAPVRPTATFTRLRALRGAWGLRVVLHSEDPLPVGTEVLTTTLAGKVEVKRVGHILWQGEDRNRPGVIIALATFL